MYASIVLFKIFILLNNNKKNITTKSNLYYIINLDILYDFIGI